jgi:hypothetical protein
MYWISALSPAVDKHRIKTNVENSPLCLYHASCNRTAARFFSRISARFFIHARRPALPLQIFWSKDAASVASHLNAAVTNRLLYPRHARCIFVACLFRRRTHRFTCKFSKLTAAARF